jgi:chromosome segregation ATPase
VPVNPPSDPSPEQKQPSTNVKHDYADILAQIKSNTEQIQQILVLVKQNQTSVNQFQADLKTVTDAQSNIREQVQSLDVTSQLEAVMQSQTQIVEGLKTSGGSTELRSQIQANAQAIAEIQVRVENNATAVTQLQVQIETGNQDLVTKIKKLETLNQKLLPQLAKRSPCSEASEDTARELSELFHILGGK